TGTLHWQRSVPIYTGLYGTDIALAPDGTIYTVTPNNLYAWNKDTGAAVWSSPVFLSNGTEHTGPIVDARGNIYINTGAGFVGVPQALTSISPAGTINWSRTFEGRGFFSPAMSTDEKTVYITHFACG